MASILSGAVTILGAAAQPQPQPPAQPAAQATAKASEAASAETDVIIVTGTRIQSPNRTSASPVETVRQEDFTITGVANVEQTLNQLPQIVPGFTNTSNNPGTGAATLDLRGLGSVRTLILVNGRRWIANDAGQIPEVDVNTIPAALIDRVDIVTGGASAVYGSDAVTGVINFVLKNKLDGLHLEARNNLTEHLDGRSGSVDLSYGTSFLGGRGNLLVSVGLLDQRPVLQGARYYTRYTLGDGCIVPGTERRDGSGEPAPDQDFDCADAGEELGLIRAGSGTIPAGRIAGRVLFPTGVGSSLQPIGGPRFTPDGSLVPFNFVTDSYNFAPDNYLQVPLARISGNLLGSIELSDHVEPYTELSFIRTRSPQQLAPALGRVGGFGTVPLFTLNLDNPFLSPQARHLLDINFGRDAEGDRGFIQSGQQFSLNPAYGGDADGIIRLPGNAAFTTRLTGLGPRRGESERNAYRGLIGTRGRVSGGFDYDAYYSRSYVKHSFPLVNSASVSRLQQAILARRDPVTGAITCIDPSGGCVPVNLFGVQDVSTEAADFVRAEALEETTVEEQVAEAVVKGPLWDLPAGPLSSAFGIHWRSTSYDFRPDRSLELGDNLGFLPSIGASGKAKVIEGFAEFLVPVLSDRPFAHDVSAELGLRYSHYSTVGGAWTWKAMANWSPLRALRLRGGLQKAVRAPNVRELFAESLTDVFAIFDPCQPLAGYLSVPEIAQGCAAIGAANVPPSPPIGLTFAPVTFSGSRELKAETARTLTLGAVVKPVRRLTVTLDYYHIDIRRAIGEFGGGLDFTLFGCVLGGDPSSPLCQSTQRDEDGTITSMVLPTANLARLRASGIDWQVIHGMDLGPGDFTIALSGTRVLKSETHPNEGIGAIDCAGSFGSPCGGTILGTATPKWKLYNRAAYTVGPVTLSLRHRYFSSTSDARIVLNDAIGLPQDNIPESARQLQSRNYFDVATAFDIDQRFQLTMGVNNLFDRKPSPVGFQQVQANTDPSLYDVLGRRFFIAVRAKVF